jgi:hypothetical protein
LSGILSLVDVGGIVDVGSPLVESCVCVSVSAIVDMFGVFAMNGLCEGVLKE